VLYWSLVGNAKFWVTFHKRNFIWAFILKLRAFPTMFKIRVRIVI
jgi:hypothetical protein